MNFFICYSTHKIVLYLIWYEFFYKVKIQLCYLESTLFFIHGTSNMCKHNTFRKINKKGKITGEENFFITKKSLINNILCAESFSHSRCYLSHTYAYLDHITLWLIANKFSVNFNLICDRQYCQYSTALIRQ